ncbi:MAG: hypothetical protein HOM14_07135 [Gammaproteobacteria bacterium]|nr:hypothetical protein [Gammaproteobacteria bacterium]MBT3722785.1 hypothetical protein [Gammaproteobacteria bacterium]MBT4077348.1 hypothetical protein [Gammaproteobacteria bacterium]MBT4193442.1 hypothetical protein [Gammaproteobacteria bacterium]MBT4450359.1 hypothetical protein [Gammaproteobacteria bacterium]
MIKLIMLSFCLLLSLSVTADNLFIELVDGKNVTDKNVADALKQLREHKEIKLKKNLSVNPFHHKKETENKLKQPFCQNCHLEKPHQVNQRNRSFLNMHTNYISCETCHLKDEGMKLKYKWLAYGYPNAGQVIDVYSSVHTEAEKVKVSILPRPGARIIPINNDQRMLVFKDEKFSREVENKWKTFSIEDKARLKANLHKPLNKKGLSCDKCHSENQKVLDFKLLGANEKQSHSITSNKIAQFFSRYKKDTDRLKMSDLLR